MEFGRVVLFLRVCYNFFFFVVAKFLFEFIEIGLLFFISLLSIPFVLGIILCHAVTPTIEQ